MTNLNNTLLNMDAKEIDQLTLHTDFYLPRWMYLHWKQGRFDKKVCFNVFYRKNPFKNGYSVFGGLLNIIKYLQNIKFSEETIAYLQNELNFDNDFAEVLRNYKFTGTMYSVEEGEIIHPNTPLIRLEGNIFELKLLQTLILTFVNHESLIATKASRINEAILEYQKTRNLSEKPRALEGGARRAHGVDAAYHGTRMAYISGFDSTSLCSASKDFDIPVGGTMEHADIQFYEDLGGELGAFRDFASVFPDQCVFLVDTFDTLRSGIPNAIKVAKELEANGHKLLGIRIDSGDLAYLSKQARKMLNEAGLDYVKIVASGDLDEYVISSLAIQKAEIDTFLIGTKAITAYEQPAFGAVYKIVSKESDGEHIPLIKISSSVNKTTNPGFQTVYRIVDKKTGMFKGDYISLINEEVDKLKEIYLEDVRNPGFENKIVDFQAMELLKPIFIEGELVYTVPTTKESRNYHLNQIDKLWEEYKRKDFPEIYPVTLSPALKELKQNLIKEKKFK